MNLILLNNVDDDALIPPLPPWDQMKILDKQKTKVIERLHSKLTGKKGRSKATWWCEVTKCPMLRKHAGQTDVVLVDETWGDGRSDAVVEMCRRKSIDQSGKPGNKKRQLIDQSRNAVDDRLKPIDQSRERFPHESRNPVDKSAHCGLEQTRIKT